jgi:hypothetical protein
MSKIDDLLQHELGLQRIATQLLNKGIYPSLDEAYKAVRLILLDSESITSPTKLKAVERKINAAVTEALNKGWSEYTRELTGIAIYDSSYYANLIGAGAGVTLKEPGKKAISNFVEAALMSLSSGQRKDVGTWGEFVRKNVSGYTEQVNNLVKAGYINGATVGQMTRTIKQYSDGLARQGAESLARTGLRHYSEAAREAMAQNNSDILEARVYFSVLDNRTTIGCGSLHLKEWKFGDDSYVRLPRHFGCRAIYLYRVKGQTQAELLGGKRPSIGSGPEFERGDRYTGRRSTQRGEFKPEQVNSTIGFGTWLKRQNHEFVTDVLGARRADLFLKGGLPIERMSSAFGRELSLAELMRREKSAFTRSGLSN